MQPKHEKTNKPSSYFIVALFALFSFLLTNAERTYAQMNPPAQNEIFSRISTVPRNAGFEMKDYWVWGCSVIKGEDSRYHMFVSRWPKTLPFHPGWMIASEIVRASSDELAGPYRFEEVVLPARGAEYWDGRSTHNPRIVKHNDTYILYYMGSTHPFPEPTSPNEVTLKSPYAIVGRANKRIGIATSKSVFGPWKRFDKPSLDVAPGTYYSYLTSNPAPAINEDGSALLIFKSRAYLPDSEKYSEMYISTAAAPNYLGPYTVLSSKPLFGPENLGVIEDPYIWKDARGFHMLAKDMGKSLANEWKAGILCHSSDGRKWQLDHSPKAYSRVIRWDDGTTQKLGQMERPFVFIEDGKAKCLFFAAMDGPGGFNNATKSWNLAIPLTD